MLNNLLEKNITLRQTRDLLLPKLISGEVDVEGLDIHVEGETYESRPDPIPSLP
jgi:type I restriction enzyme, S subunit